MHIRCAETDDHWRKVGHRRVVDNIEDVLLAKWWYHWIRLWCADYRKYITEIDSQ
jgi:hypothetical protein